MPHDHDENHVHNLLPAEPALRVKALETILLEKGLIDQQAVDAIIDAYEQSSFVGLRPPRRPFFDGRRSTNGA